MVISSITDKIVLSEPDEIERFVKAIEESSQSEKTQQSGQRQTADSRAGIWMSTKDEAVRLHEMRKKARLSKAQA